MARCGWGRLIEEWSRSAEILADVLGEPVRVASVPGGAFSRRVADRGVRRLPRRDYRLPRRSSITGRVRSMILRSSSADWRRMYSRS